MIYSNLTLGTLNPDRRGSGLIWVGGDTDAAGGNADGGWKFTDDYVLSIYAGGFVFGDCAGDDRGSFFGLGKGVIEGLIDPS